MMRFHDTALTGGESWLPMSPFYGKVTGSPFRLSFAFKGYPDSLLKILSNAPGLLSLSLLRSPIDSCLADVSFSFC